MFQTTNWSETIGFSSARPHLAVRQINEIYFDQNKIKMRN